MAILPVGIDFGVESTFPMPGPISSGLLMSIAQLVGIILVITSTALISVLSKTGCLFAQLILISVAIIGLMFALMVK